ncbi:hypothetical protein [Microvirga splendida]|uniref:Uncharacterized protein n=1 Tax=Microvirga splendida TaxID=2795727 RepID=A0ABS0XZF0_9HYPH|nr:hypothetical protein [Microvirga splendida]MBJ6125408.1 hypothetical protein [Microvirga splendida]
MRCENPDESILGKLSLREVKDIIEMVTKYSPSKTGNIPVTSNGYYCYPDPRLEDLGHRSSSDDEGWPRERDIALYRYKDARREYGEYVWQVKVGWESTNGEDFDYIENPPVGEKFKLNNYWIQREIDTLAEELTALRDLCSGLDHSTSTLEEWAASGLGAAIVCCEAWCSRDIVYVQNDWLIERAKLGLSLSDLMGRIRCTKCGKRNAKLRPYPNRA